MIERVKSKENSIRLDVMKREYLNKVKKIKGLIDENEQMVDKVAQNEIDIEQKDIEI
jgi:hypothetical protein